MGADTQKVILSMEGEDRSIVVTLSPLDSPPTGKTPYRAFVVGYVDGIDKYNPVEEAKRSEVEKELKDGSYLVKSIIFSNEPLTGDWHNFFYGISGS